MATNTCSTRDYLQPGRRKMLRAAKPMLFDSRNEPLVNRGKGVTTLQPSETEDRDDRIDMFCVPASTQGEGRRGSRRHASPFCAARLLLVLRLGQMIHLIRSWPGSARLGPAIHGTQRTSCRFPWMPGTRACPRAAGSADPWAGHERFGRNWII